MYVLNTTTDLPWRINNLRVNTAAIPSGSPVRKKTVLFSELDP